MSLLEAIVLGLVQGLTEFLPISSSGHLIVVPWLVGWDEPGLSFDAALHLGTLFAVLTYFWRELLAMIVAAPTALSKNVRLLNGTDPLANQTDRDARLALLLILGSIPGGIAGLIFQNKIDDFFHGDNHRRWAIALIGVASIIFALLLWLAESVATRRRMIGDLGMSDAASIGLAQAAALFPGVSRSGITLTAGLVRGLKRADAARFAFLLGIPLTALASLKGLSDLIQNDSGIGATNLIVGIAVSAISGFAAISFLLRYLQRSNTMVFVVYRISLGVLLIGLVVGGFR